MCRYFSLFAGIGGFELGIIRSVGDKRGFNELQESQRTNGDTPENNVCLEECCGTRGVNPRSFQPDNPQGSAELNGLENELAKWECVGCSETNKYASAIYQYHFPTHKNYGDATRIDTSELSNLDLLVAGFPCQAFSIAGNRQGFQDTRGILFFEIVRICRDKRPRYILLENVKGLLSHESGETFQRILKVLADLGYVLQWEVLNSKNYGVPQNRERVFIVGSLRGEPRPEVFPIGECLEAYSQDDEQKRRGMVETAYCLRGGTRQRYDAETVVMQMRHRTKGKPRVYNDEIPAMAQDYGTGGQNVPIVVPIMMRDGRDNRSCLRSGRTPEIGFEGHSLRRLTPTECERLQGFPDGWTEYGIMGGEKRKISDTQRYRCLGNAVTVPVVTAIIHRLMEGL